MFAHYPVAVAAVLALIAVSFWRGATLTDVVTGFSTGLAATMVLVFVVKGIYEEADRRHRAPATLAALHNCTLIFNDFRYLWIDMANSLGLAHDGKWYQKELFDEIEQRLNLQDRAQSHGLSPFSRRADGSLEHVTITWETAIELVRARIRKNVAKAFTRYIMYLDPQILVILHHIENGAFLSVLFDGYKGKPGFKGIGPGMLFRFLKSDIDNFHELESRMDQVYDTIESEEARRIFEGLMYGVRLRPTS
jgi:hypothetical protein